MSVLIKGMKMPKACYECCMYEADIYYCVAAERDINIPSSDEGKCSFCPLIELPYHGDSISRQAAIAYSISGMTREIDGEKWIRVSEVRESIKTMPTAERVGKWIRHPEVKNIYGGVCIECSECREKYVVQYVEDEKFCRNCGARMAEGGDAE